MSAAVPGAGVPRPRARPPPDPAPAHPTDPGPPRRGACSKEQVDWVMPAAAFAALNLVKLGVVTWKLDKIGLVPKEVADFFSETPVPAVVEFSG